MKKKNLLNIFTFTFLFSLITLLTFSNSFVNAAESPVPAKYVFDPDKGHICYCNDRSNSCTCYF